MFPYLNIFGALKSNGNNHFLVHPSMLLLSLHGVSCFYMICYIVINVIVEYHITISYSDLIIIYVTGFAKRDAYIQLSNS